MNATNCHAVAMTGLAGAGCSLLLSPRTASADDEPEIVVEAGASEIFIGESVDYVVEIRNVKNPAPPDLSALRQDFDVVAARRRVAESIVHVHHQRQGHPAEQLRSRLSFPPDAEANRQADDPGAHPRRSTARPSRAAHWR